jgi:hypothetical protein
MIIRNTVEVLEGASNPRRPRVWEGLESKKASSLGLERYGPICVVLLKAHNLKVKLQFY